MDVNAGQSNSGLYGWTIGMGLRLIYAAAGAAICLRLLSVFLFSVLAGTSSLRALLIVECALALAVGFVAGAWTQLWRRSTTITYGLIMSVLVMIFEALSKQMLVGYLMVSSSGTGHASEAMALGIGTLLGTLVIRRRGFPHAPGRGALALLLLLMPVVAVAMTLFLAHAAEPYYFSPRVWHTIKVEKVPMYPGAHHILSRGTAVLRQIDYQVESRPDLVLGFYTYEFARQGLSSVYESHLRAVPRPGVSAQNKEEFWHIWRDAAGLEIVVSAYYARIARTRHDEPGAVRGGGQTTVRVRVVITPISRSLL